MTVSVTDGIPKPDMLSFEATGTCFAPEFTDKSKKNFQKGYDFPLARQAT